MQPRCAVQVDESIHMEEELRLYSGEFAAYHFRSKTGPHTLYSSAKEEDL